MTASDITAIAALRSHHHTWTPVHPTHHFSGIDQRPGETTTHMTTDGRVWLVATTAPSPLQRRRSRLLALACAALVGLVGLGACVATTDAATSQQAQESVVCQQILCYPYTAVVHQGVLTVGVDPAADAGCRVGCEGAVGHCSTDWDGGGSHQEGVRTLVDVAWELYDAPLAQANFINQQGGTCESTSAF